MFKVGAVVMASMLVITSSTTAFAAPKTDLPYVDDFLLGTSGQNHIFDGVDLNEQQRQQMRDLMRQVHDGPSGLNVVEIDTMYKLVTANKFDDAAVYAQAEKMVHQQVKHQVQLARIRNQMYNLLTPEQKNVLDQKHQQRMQHLSGLQQTSAQKLSTTE